MCEWPGSVPHTISMATSPVSEFGNRPGAVQSNAHTHACHDSVLPVHFTHAHYVTPLIVSYKLGTMLPVRLCTPAVESVKVFFFYSPQPHSGPIYNDRSQVHNGHCTMHTGLGENSDQGAKPRSLL